MMCEKAVNELNKINLTHLKSCYPLTRMAINFVAVSTLIIFLVSLFAPLFTLEKFFIFSNSVSLVSALITLLEKGNWLVFLIIFIFSILFPLFKLGVILFIWNSHADETIRKLLHWIHHLGKWSMLDVFVVALMVVSIKFDQVANMQIHIGLYLFLTAVLLSMIISAISYQFLERHISL